MNQPLLNEIAKRLTNPPKGILAIDESTSTCNKRFSKLGIPETEASRQLYREMLVTARGIENYVSGYILYDETIRQSTRDGRTFVSILKLNDIDVGIKVDTGTKDFNASPIEKYTDGLDGLDVRLKEYKSLGATFAKWRAVYSISSVTPTEECMKRNAQDLAEYAYLCQLNDIVPIVEPEVLLEGDHSIEKCYEITSKNLNFIFSALKVKGVYMGGVILKTSMVLAGKNATNKSTTTQIAEETIKCLKENVPADIGGIVFLSGGQDDLDATKNLNMMHKMGDLPWNLTFSYGRAIQNEALKHFALNTDDFAGAQAKLIQKAQENSKAAIGEFE